MTTETEANCHPDCGPIVAHNEEGQHCHESKDGRCWHEDGDRETFPTTRHMSIQAWRRLNKTLTNGELKDLAADIAAFVGLSEEQKEEIVFALTGFNWEPRKQI